MPPTRKKASRKYRVKAAIAPKRQAPCTFPFLELPAELRNRIYEYALTTPYGIKMTWQMGKSRRHKKPSAWGNRTSGAADVPINQLQYVNKQIRQEAAGLEIQYNTVHFESNPRKKMGKPIANFLQFCGSIAPLRLDWLSHVVIDGFWYREPPAPTYRNFGDWIVDSDVARQISRLLRQAQVLPQLRVDLRVPTFELIGDLPSFVLTGLRLSYIVRGTEHVTTAGQHVPTRAMIGTVEEYLHEDDIKAFRACTENVPHLRFLPHNIEAGRERLETILRDTPTDLPGMTMTPESRTMLLHAQGWFSEGV